ncbi:NFX1-type zinc finger-containing protein 1-like isoform X2 [Paramormyrops kingsleyae]|uniref:NFX1-type zinc finger-containing protein 1-like n=1 Tax=Paramormyrops kingsleyae TaxID=1676925 RepID=A0A3B3STT6_9TELE|nr:NFX1-type zinc finger-containing protein 1-like isoform X2 [Paramormyrops kingsleyae]
MSENGNQAMETVRNRVSGGHSWNIRTGRSRRRPGHRQEHNETSDDFQQQKGVVPFKTGSTFAQNNAKRGYRHSSQTFRSETQPSDAAWNQIPRRSQSGLQRSGARQKEHTSRTTQPLVSQRTVSQPNLLNINDNGSKVPTDHCKKLHRSQKLDMRALETILQMEPSEIVMKLAAPGSGLNNLLNTEEETSDSVLSKILDVLSKACSSRTNRQNLQHLLVEVKESKFVKCLLPLFIMNIDKPKDQLEMEGTIDKINKIMDLYLTLVDIFPSSTIVVVSLGLAVLETQMSKLQSYTGISVPKETQNKVEKLQMIVTHLKNKKHERTFQSDSYTLLLEDYDESSIENFRVMSIFPSFGDIHTTKKPFIRPNIITEKFADSDTYLDTHFRLQREDFVKPLRDGISQLLMGNDNDKMQQRLDIRVYFNASITSPVCTPKGILYQIRFDTKNLKYVNWETSKRLLYGALICLSMDNFRTMIFATVGHRDIKELKKGVVNVFFNDENRVRLANISQKSSFLMVETTAFFEAYRHVLEGLQEINAEDLPMQKYIVMCESDITPPKYLQDNKGNYSLWALMNDCAKISNLQKPALQNRKQQFQRPVYQRQLVGKEGDVKNILNLNDWPSKENLKLDTSQMKAVQLALTKELAIIQGPPGTGKTHVGLKIVKALLDNAQVWGIGCSSPILVVCYTNHALDQFLEGILKYMTDPLGLVRVGGRSSSDIIKNYSLNKLRSNQRASRACLPGHLKAMHSDLKEKMKKAEEEVGRNASLLEISENGILNESILCEHIVSLHGSSLEAGRPLEEYYVGSEREQSVILEWLGISVINSGPHCMGGGNGVSENAEGATQEEGLAQDLDCLSWSPQAACGDNVGEALMDAVSDDNTLDCFEQEQAERMMEGDNVEKHIQSAHNRIYTMEREAMACVLKEEEEELRDKNEEDGYDQGWEITKEMKKRLKRFIKAELKKTDHMTKTEALRISNLWALPSIQRWSLYRLWVSLFRQDLKEKLLESENNFQRIIERLDELRNAEDEMILKNASIIGMTTTCAARYRKVLQGIQPKIVVVEEAAEVMEAHIVMALTPGCEHLILIGDHQQLRPSATVYQLAINFNLEVSLFERLIKMKIPYVRLDYQHRMRPEIARLLTPYIYDQLENDSSVYEYENIKGVTSNVFFVEHEHLEENISEGRSHQNKHEATFVKALCYYFICQGAKKGLFCIGNMSMLSTVPLWGKIIKELRSHGEIGKALNLRCKNHPGTITTVSEEADFSKVPLGGCSVPCEHQLDCDHGCPRLCHPVDDHKQYKCMKPCTKTLCQFKHKCPKVCSDICGKCKVPVTKVIPRCNHEQLVPCSVDPEEFVCTVPCTKTLQCGHACIRKCGESCTSRCPQNVTVDLDCGHQRVLPCHIKQEVDCKQGKIQCLKKCNAQLDCGHMCTGKCFQCNNGTAHITCVAQCEVQLICSHCCKEKCGASCVPCFQPCKNQCLHQICPKVCSEACQPCTQPCPWQCRHQRCTRLCHEPCDRLPCQMPCFKRLPCQHQCIGMCGEPCPDKCRICDAGDVQELFFGKEADPEAHFVQLSDCRHIFEVTGFDSWMGSPDGNRIKFKSCPKCCMPILRTVRYGAVVKLLLSDIELLKSRAAKMYSEYIKNSVRGRIKQGINCQFFSLLLPRLEDHLDLSGAHNIHRQVVLLSHLADITLNTAQLPKSLRVEIDLKVQSCSKNVTHVTQLGWVLENDVRRIQVFAEALVYLDRLNHSQAHVSVEFMQERKSLDDILHRLRYRLTEVDLNHIRLTLRSISEKVKTPIEWRALKESDVSADICGFLKLSHWSKCTEGHIYYNRSADSVQETFCCPECLTI